MIIQLLCHTKVFTVPVTRDGTWQIFRHVFKAGFAIDDGLDKIW